MFGLVLRAVCVELLFFDSLESYSCSEGNSPSRVWLSRASQEREFLFGSRAIELGDLIEGFQFT